MRGADIKALSALNKAHPETLRLPEKMPCELPCHCCTRSFMKATPSPPLIEKVTQPLEEVHFDLFFHGGQIYLFLIDRCSRHPFVYKMERKSEIGCWLQQFLIDVNTSQHGVGSFILTLPSKNGSRKAKDCLDVDAVNKHLQSKGASQRVKVLYSDNESSVGSVTSAFISNMFIKHNTIIPGSSWQNGLAECNGGWWLGGAIRYDFDLCGLSVSKFLPHCIYLNVERRAHTPRESLGGKTPSEILFPSRQPPLHRFKLFGCHATILKDARALKDKLVIVPRGEQGIYVGTAHAYNQSGFLLWMPTRNRFVVATHV
jgi:hypothetical protein